MPDEDLFGLKHYCNNAQGRELIQWVYFFFKSPSILSLGLRIEFQRLSQNNRILYLPGRDTQKLVFACSAAYVIYPCGTQS